MNDVLCCESCEKFCWESLKDLKGVCGRFGMKVDAYTVHCNYHTGLKTKVKPRRLCDFCERRISVLDDYGRYTMESVKTESCPTVNLTTGERTEPDENGEYVLLIFDENGHGIDPGMFPIKFCPYCGRKLGGE